MQTFTDQLGRVTKQPSATVRIVSLVPSLTEILSYLNLDSETAGLTKFCVHPEEWLRSKTVVGGTKKLHHDKIQALNPTLIIANKEENEASDIAALEKKYAVYVSDIKSVEDCCNFISDLSAITERQQLGQKLNDSIQYTLSQLNPLKETQSVLYCIWKSPWMFAGQNTFINHMLKISGLNNLADTERYPRFTLNEVKKLAPQVLMLSSEPFPFKEKYRIELEKELPDTAVILVDGEYFSWYGSRIIEAVPYLNSLLLKLKSH